MSVLVTGASGFVGLNVLEALLGSGEGVLATSRDPIPPDAMQAFDRLPGLLDPVVVDVTDAEAILRLIENRRPRKIVHAAAITPGTRTELDQAAAALAVNVVGTAHVLEGARRAGIERVVLVSSASVYGDNSFGSEQLDELATAPAPRTVYATSKRAAEQLALRFRDRAALDVTAVRLSAAFGPWERETGARETLSPFWQTLTLARLGREAVLDRICRRDWIYSRDAAGAIVGLLEFPGPVPPIINLGPGRVIPFDAWLESLRARFPDFRWRRGPKDEANVDFHGDLDRSVLSVRLLESLLRWAPRSPGAAFDDYLAWSDGKPGAADSGDV